MDEVSKPKIEIVNLESLLDRLSEKHPNVQINFINSVVNITHSAITQTTAIDIQSMVVSLDLTDAQKHSLLRSIEPEVAKLEKKTSLKERLESLKIITEICEKIGPKAMELMPQLMGWVTEQLGKLG